MTTRARKGDRVIAVMANVNPDEPRPHVWCRRCGERVVTEVPMRIDTYLAITKGFLAVHKECKDRAA